MTHPLTQYRQTHDLTQQALAHVLKTTRATINRWESGVRAITAEKAVDIENLTNGRVKRSRLRPDLFKNSRAETT